MKPDSLQASEKLVASLFGAKALRRVLVARYRRQLDGFLSSGDTIDFAPPGREPDLSVIIPTYNSAHHLLRCLQSIAGTHRANLQVIVYDDCSEDRTAQLAAKCRNLTYIRGQSNLGFIGAVTAAATRANGRHLLLMNADTTLREGCLGAGVSLLDGNPAWGMIGVRIRLATGKLQEAGCMIFSDGTTDGYLRARPAHDPLALFCREVDFASGAFLYVRGDAFRQEGGFDRAFAPAYYEETDLAMRFRQRGLKCIYIPGILVEHFEFGSQPKSAAMQAIAARRAIFMKKWGRALATGEFGPSTSNWDRYGLRRTPSPRALLVASGNGRPEYVHRAQAGHGFLGLYLLDGEASEQSRQRWGLGPDMPLLAGNWKQLQQHLAGMNGFYQTVLAAEPKLLESLQSLGQGQGHGVLFANLPVLQAPAPAPEVSEEGP